jgi:hypothetical protein
MTLRFATLLLLVGLVVGAVGGAPEPVQAAARQAAWFAGTWTLISALSLCFVVAAFRAVARWNELTSRAARRQEWLAAAVTVPGTARR